MRPLHVWTPKAPPPAWSVHESPDQTEEREARMAEVMALAQKHTAKATVPDPAAQRLAELRRILDELCCEYALALDTPERAWHLAEAARRLRTMIARVEVLHHNADGPPRR